MSVFTPDAFFGQTSQGIARIEPKCTDVDLDEVRLDLLEVDRNAGSLQSLREPTRPGVVVRQTLDIVVERIDPGGGDDPGLPHRSTELVLETARLSHQVVRAGNERPQRTAETLRETQRHRVELPSDLRRRHTARDRRVQHPRAIEMNGELELPAR